MKKIITPYKASWLATLSVLAGLIIFTITIDMSHQSYTYIIDAIALLLIIGGIFFIL